MPGNDFCAECGTALQANWPKGLCPVCALKGAFDLPKAETGMRPAKDSGTSAARIGPGDHIGHYKLLQQIGEGGFGTVWMAEQEKPVRRRVALKIIKLGMDTRQVVARFEAERQALAMMEHPGIARVFDGGATETGRPYFVMELVRGVRITDYCDENKLATRERLALFIEVCHAVQHAHLKGIIHRDLKPSNILVTEQDGRPVPKVIDFGVAKAMQQQLTERTLFTSFDQILGTPAYMSPEQAGLGGLDIDTRSDVYSLGVLLYELLTGRTPFTKEEFQKAGFDGIIRLIREQDPPKPSTRLSSLTHEELTTIAAQRQSEPAKLNRLVRGELDWVAMKALEKNRSRRYQSATAFAEDVQRYLNDEPVTAAAPSAFYRMGKFARRHKTGLSVTAVISALLVAATAVSLRLATVADVERGKAKQAQNAESVQRQAAETNAAESLERLVRIDVANGVRAMESSDWFGALLWFTEALRQDKPGTRAEEMHRFRIGALLNYSPRLTQVWFHDAAINHAVYSPDGRWVLTASRDQTARLWNVLTERSGVVLRHATNVSQAAFNADGRRVLTLSDDGSVRVWDSVAGQLICSPLEHGYRVTHALISPDGRRVFTLGNPGETNFTGSFQRSSSEAGEVRIWDAATGRPVRSSFRQKKRISDLALSPDGQWLAANLGKSILIWNLRQPQAIQLSSGTEGKSTILPGLPPGQSAEEIETLLPEIPRESRADDENPWVFCLAFSPDSQRIATSYGDGSGRIWRLRGGVPMVLQQPKTRGTSAARSQARAAHFSPDGQRVMLLSDDGIARLWDARTGESEGQLKGKAQSHARFSPDSRFVFLDGSAQGWDLESDEFLTPSLPAPWSAMENAAFSPNGATLLTAGSDGVARLWSLAGGLPPQPPLKHDWAIIAAQRAASAEQKTANIRAQMMESMLTAFSDDSHDAFSPDGRRVATVSWNGSARVWDAATGEPITPYVIMDWPLVFAAFSPDGTRFVTAGGSPPDSELGAARVWDARSGQPVTPVIKHPHSLNSAAFSPDGRWLITQASRSALIWDARTGEPAALPMKFGASICSAAFSPEGNLLAVCQSGLNDPAQSSGSVQPATNTPWQTRLWDEKSGQLVRTLLQETNEVSLMEFSPDGRWLVTFVRYEDDFSQSVRLWNVATGQPVTPPLPASGGPKPAFTQDGRRLFVTGLFCEPIALELPAGRRLDSAEWRGLKMDPAAVTMDGQRFATANRELRVYDALTGEPLTPLLQKLGSSSYGETTFSPDGSLLLVPGDKRAQLWPLPRETRPVKELVLLAQLLAARGIDGSGNLVLWKSAEASAAWQMLRAKYPSSFAIAPEQVRRWRERLVETAEKEERWNTAVFHLEQLAKTQPDDEALLLRHARARNHAAMEELR